MKKLMFAVAFLLLIVSFGVVSASPTVNTFLNYIPSSNSMTAVQGDTIELSLVAFSHGEKLSKEKLEILGESLLLLENEEGIQMDSMSVFNKIYSYKYIRSYILDAEDLDVGTYTIRFTASSISGTTEYSELELIILAKPDTILPTLEITYPTNGATYANQITTLTFDVYDENLDSCTYSLNGNIANVNSLSNGVNTITGITSVIGSNTWSVTCEDTSGNDVTDSVIFTVNIPVVDTTDPTLSISYPVDSMIYTTHVTELTFDVYDENLNSCTYSLNGAAPITVAEAHNGVNTITGITSVEYSNTWSVTCADDAGNYETEYTTFSILLPDTTLPTLEIIYPTNGTIYTNQITTLTFDVYDENLDSCTYSLNGNIANVNSLSNGVNTVTGITSIDGLNAWGVTCLDVAGNEVNDEVTFTVDTTIIDDTVPEVEIISPVNQTYTNNVTNLTFTVFDENLNSCNYSLDGIIYTDVTPLSNGVNTITGITSIEGPNAWHVTCDDAEGNTNITVVTFIVNTTAVTTQLTLGVASPNYNAEYTYGLEFEVFTNKNANVTYSLLGSNNVSMTLGSNYVYSSSYLNLDVGEYDVIFCANDGVEIVCRDSKFEIIKKKNKKKYPTYVNWTDDEHSVNINYVNWTDESAKVIKLNLGEDEKTSLWYIWWLLILIMIVIFITILKLIKKL